MTGCIISNNLFFIRLSGVDSSPESLFHSLLHTSSRSLSLMDEPLLAMLRRLADSGALNRTLLVVTGDHGQRVDTITKTFVGRIEERASFLSLRFPPW